MKSNLLRTSLLVLFIMTTSFSCQRKSAKPDIEKAIADLTDKFPQLPKGKTNQSDFYKLTRTVTYGKNEFQLQLFSTPDSIKDKQQIIILMNSKGDYYAIPFFSNKYRDYWNFELEKPIAGVKKTNTTFEQEITKAINTLNLNDTIGTGAKVFEEMLLSLLNCQSIRETDSKLFEAIWPTWYKDQPEDDRDSCIKKQCANFRTIVKRIHQSENYYNYNAYLDVRNDRIYQIVNQGKDRGKKFKPEIKMYRQNCNKSFHYE
jgi:hypothetical protein